MKRTIYLLILCTLILSNSCQDESVATLPHDYRNVTFYISPDTIKCGQTLCIYGNDFGLYSSNSKVFIDTLIIHDVEFWSKTLIKITIPKEAKSGKLWVVNTNFMSDKLDICIIPEFVIDTNRLAENEMIYIPPGVYINGVTGNDQGYHPHNPYNDTIKKAFYMSKYEITQQQFQVIMGYNPSNNIGRNNPVERITFYQACEFCNKLSELEGYSKCYSGTLDTNLVCDFTANGYRLPTESEWEYACKAGTTTDVYNGDFTTMNDYEHDPQLDLIAWYCLNSNSRTHQVGLLKPNSFGLYDMLGNVGEYIWGLHIYKDIMNLVKVNRILRGGDYTSKKSVCIPGLNYFETSQYFWASFFGFRIVRNAN